MDSVANIYLLSHILSHDELKTLKYRSLPYYNSTLPPQFLGNASVFVRENNDCMLFVVKTNFIQDHYSQKSTGISISSFQLMTSSILRPSHPFMCLHLKPEEGRVEQLNAEQHSRDQW